MDRGDAEFDWAPAPSKVSLGFKVKGVGLRLQGLGFQGLEFRVSSSGLRVWG